MYNERNHRLKWVRSQQQIKRRMYRTRYALWKWLMFIVASTTLALIFVTTLAASKGFWVEHLFWLKMAMAAGILLSAVVISNEPEKP